MDEALGDTKALFPPSSASVPDAAPTTAIVSTAVLMKLPVFWPEAAEVWFAQTDAQFAIRHVSSSRTKFYPAIAVLPQEVASQILNLIRAPPAGDPYKVLRERPEAVPLDEQNVSSVSG